MRKLMWFTLGFGAACAFCSYAWIQNGLLLPAVLFACLFGASLLAARWVPKMKIAAAILLGISLGLGWVHIYSSAYLSHAASVDGSVAEVTAYCTDYSYETDYGCAVDGVLYLDGKPYRSKFYIHADVQMSPGDVLNGTFELRVTTSDNTSGATYHQGKGIFLLAYQEEGIRIGKLSDTPLWAYPAILSERLTVLIENSFPSDVSGFAKALLLGDRTDIDYELNTTFKVSGIMHIIAVSGLHVTILFTLINLLCFKRRWLVALFGIPALFLFAAIAGFSPSVTRACIMQALMIGAMLLDKEYDGPTELAFASLVMLAANPLVITSVSFQLSVGCMIGIFLFQKRINDWLCDKLGCGKGQRFLRLKRWFAGSVSMTFSAISLTTPLSAYYFGAVSLVGILTNLLTLWVISFIFYGIIAVCVLGLVFPGWAAVAAGIIAWPIRYVLWIADLLAGFPLAAVYTRSVYIVAWLVFCYVLLAVFLLGKKKNPGMLAVCMIAGLLLSVGASWLEPRTDSCRMTVLSVGQGQSILFQSDGKTYMVDCGGSYDDDAADIAAETLLSQGISHIDGLILTHFDRDHAGGVANLLTRITVDEILVPDYEDTTGTVQKLEMIAPGALSVVSEDMQISYGETIISVYCPIVPDSNNESSLAVLFQKENCDILITGDRSDFGERMLLKTADIPKLDVLVAGHHGSKYSTCEELLEATRPTLVAISVGDNSYGHPAEETLERLERYGCIVYRTDIHGNITFRR